MIVKLHLLMHRESYATLMVVILSHCEFRKIIIISFIKVNPQINWLNCHNKMCCYRSQKPLWVLSEHKPLRNLRINHIFSKCNSGNQS